MEQGSSKKANTGRIFKDLSPESDRTEQNWRHPKRFLSTEEAESKSKEQEIEEATRFSLSLNLSLVAHEIPNEKQTMESKELGIVRLTRSCAFSLTFSEADTEDISTIYIYTQAGEVRDNVSITMFTFH